MSSKSINLPPEIDREARKIARRDGVTVERFVASAVSAMIVADRSMRAAKLMDKAVARDRLIELLEKAPDVPPMPGDEMPPDLAEKLKKFRARRSSR